MTTKLDALFKRTQNTATKACGNEENEKEQFSLHDSTIPNQSAPDV